MSFKKQNRAIVGEAVFGGRAVKSASEYGMQIEPTLYKTPIKRAQVGGQFLGIDEVNRTELITLLHQAWKTRAAFCVWGETGVSKSATIRSFADMIFKKHYEPKGRQKLFLNGLSRPKNADFDKIKNSADKAYVQAGINRGDLEPTTGFEKLSDDHPIFKNPERYFFIADIRMAYLEEIDIKGLPYSDVEGGVTRFLPPPLVKLCSDKRAAGILFFDEINRCDKKAVLSSVLPIFDVGQRVLGLVPMEGDLFPVAAANWGQQFNGVDDLDAAILQRMEQYYLNLSVREWLQWARGKDERTKVGQTQNIHPFVCDFIEWLPDGTQWHGRHDSKAPYDLPGMDSNVIEKLLKYPTYRGWELLSDAMYTAEQSLQEGELSSWSEAIRIACQRAGGTCSTYFKDAFILFAQQVASSYALEDVAKMDLNDAGKKNIVADASLNNLLKWGEAFYIEKDKNAEKKVMAWTKQLLSLGPETVRAKLTEFKQACSQATGPDAASVRGLPGMVFGPAFYNFLEGEVKNGNITQGDADRVTKVVEGVVGIRNKTGP